MGYHDGSPMRFPSVVATFDWSWLIVGDHQELWSDETTIQDSGLIPQSKR